jgi:carbon-monoxide dehydrogenase medium subunit
MKVSNFTLHEPEDLARAYGVLAKYGKKARILAGGTDLILDLKLGNKKIDHVVSLAKLDELKNIFVKNDELWIGALVTLARVAASEDVKEHIPVLSEAAASMASTQIRNMGTIGGNVANAVPSADMPPALIAAGAVAFITGPDGEKKVPLKEFFVGPRQSVLKRGEVLNQIVIPAIADNTGIAYNKVMLRKTNSLAVASAAARITLEGEVIKSTAIVLGAVAPTPMVAEKASSGLEGRTPDEKTFEEAAKTAAAESKPLSDIRGSRQYRRDLVEALTKRSLHEAYQRATKG